MAACPRGHSLPWLIGWTGLPSSFFATPIFTTPRWPLRVTSTSASMTRTCNPQPAWHKGQMLGFHSATPGTSSSSGTKRIRWFSGLPQLASVALVPVTAESFMNARRSMALMSRSSKVTRQTIVGCVLALMTIDAKAHAQIDNALGDRLPADVAVTGRALDAGADVGRVVEAHVRLGRVAVDALPRDVHALALELGDRLDDGPVGGDRRVADQARLHARKTGDGTFGHALMTVLGARESLRDVHVVRKRDRLHGLRPHAEKVLDRRACRAARGCEHRRRLGLAAWRRVTSGDAASSRDEQQKSRAVVRQARHGASAGSAFAGQAPHVVDDVPDLLLGELALEPLHLELRTGAFADDHEDFAVARSAIPFVVDQVRGVCVLRRHRTVAFGVGAVAEFAVLIERLLARGDRLGSRRHRVLHLLSVRAPVQLLPARPDHEHAERPPCECENQTF